MLNTVVPIPLCVWTWVYEPCEYFTSLQLLVQKRLEDLVPEILYVRAFKFAVSRDVYIGVQLKFTLYMCIYIVDKS